MSEKRGWPYDPVETNPRPAPVIEVAEPGPSPLPPPPVSTARPYALVGLVVVITTAVLLSGFAAFDWYGRNQELDVLLDRIEVAERAQVHDVLDPLQRSCFTLPEACDPDAIVRAATAALPELRRSGEAVAKTRLARHHGSLRRFRDRYVEHNIAWQTWFAALAGGRFGLQSPGYQIGVSWRDAGEAAHEAVPPLPLNGSRARVQRIFDR